MSGSLLCLLFVTHIICFLTQPSVAFRCTYDSAWDVCHEAGDVTDFEWECSLCSELIAYPKCMRQTKSKSGTVTHLGIDPLSPDCPGAGHVCTYTTDCSQIYKYGHIESIKKSKIRKKKYLWLWSSHFPPESVRADEIPPAKRHQPLRSSWYYNFRAMSPRYFARVAKGKGKRFRADATYKFIVRQDAPFTMLMFQTPRGAGHGTIPSHASLLSKEEYAASRKGDFIILYAGEFSTDDERKVTHWSNASGRFKPNPCCALEFAEFWGLPMEEDAFRDISAAEQDSEDTYSESYSDAAARISLADDTLRLRTFANEYRNAGRSRAKRKYEMIADQYVRELNNLKRSD